MDAPFRIVGDDKLRFWSKVHKTEVCWLWTAGRNGAGYGSIRIQDRQRLAHRVSYEWEHGALADDVQVDHMCHNTSCVNPDHLRAVTNALNGQNRRGAHRDSKSGVRGVIWYAPTSKWRAEAMVGGIRTHVGYFDTIAEAETAITEWRRENMPYSIMDQRKEA